MSSTNLDQNLLFGFIALQNGLLTREDLVAATSVWLQDKSIPLDRVLLDRGLLTPESHEMLQPLVRHHMAQYEGDAEKSLAAIDAVSSVREELQRLGDADLEASLAQAPRMRSFGGDTTRTNAWSPSSPDSRYQVLRPHAKGGLGLVSVALDGELKREVAFKEIQEKYAHDADGRARFLREAEITGGLEHPGIVPVYGLGHYPDGRPYYTMRLIRGGNLRDAIKRFHDVETGQPSGTEKLMALRQLLRQFVDVCNAVEYAHSRGILHRDIKPGNVMLGKYGETLVVDWGLAKPIGRSEEHRSKGEETLQPMSGANSNHTRVGSAVGTPSFMSPEQAAGRLDHLGPASDVYSLGATLYCILTGRAPLHESDADTAIRKAQQGDFPPPCKVKPDVPRVLEAVCLKAMALEPTARYASAANLATDVDRWLADEPIAAYREPHLKRVARFVKRHQVECAGAVGAVLVAILALGIGLTVMSAQNRTLRSLAEQRRRELYIADTNAAFRAWENNDLSESAALLKRHVPRGAEKDLRKFEWYYVWRLCRNAWSAAAFHDTERVIDVCISEDGSVIGFVGDANEVRVFLDADSLDKGVPIELAGHTEQLRAVAISSDGSTLASGGYDCSVRLWDLNALRRTPPVVTAVELTGHTSVVRGLAFSPDGKTIASCGQDHTIKLWDLSRGLEAAARREPSTLTDHSDFVWSVAFSPDGRTLASCDRSGILLLRQFTDAKSTSGEVRRITLPSAPAISVTFSPDSQVVAVGGDGVLSMWNVASGERLPAAGDVGTHAVYDIQFLPPSGLVASTGPNHTIDLWSDSLWERAGSLRGHLGNVRSLDFSPGSGTLVSGSEDRSVRLVKIDEQDTSRGSHRDVAFAQGCSLDGTQLVTGGRDGAIRLWDVATGETQVFFQDPTFVSNTITGMALSPDGSIIVSGHRDGTIHCWNRATKERMHTWSAGDSLHSVAISPSGNVLVSRSGDGLARAWSVNDGSPLGEFEVGRNARLFFDKHLFVLRNDAGAIESWDVETAPRRIQSTPLRTRIAGQVIMRGGRLAVVDQDSGISVFETSSGRLISQWESNALSRSIALSPDGKTLAVSTSQGSIVFWDVESKTRRFSRSITSFADHVYFVDSRTLAYLEAGRRFKFLRAATAREVAMTEW